MPIYDYQCTDCKAADLRVAGLDDQVAVCHLCGGRMIRTSDPFIVLWDERRPLEKPHAQDLAFSG